MNLLYPGFGLGSPSGRLFAFGLGSWFRVKVKIVGGGFGLIGKEVLELLPVQFEIEVGVFGRSFKKSFIFDSRVLEVSFVVKMKEILYKLCELKQVVIKVVSFWRS